MEKEEETKVHEQKSALYHKGRKPNDLISFFRLLRDFFVLLNVTLSFTYLTFTIIHTLKCPWSLTKFCFLIVYQIALKNLLSLYLLEEDEASLRYPLTSDPPLFSTLPYPIKLNILCTCFFTFLSRGSLHPPYYHSMEPLHIYFCSLVAYVGHFFLYHSFSKKRPFIR